MPVRSSLKCIYYNNVDVCSQLEQLEGTSENGPCESDVGSPAVDVEVGQEVDFGDGRSRSLLLPRDIFGLLVHLIRVVSHLGQEVSSSLGQQLIFL